ncbi:MAG: PAS domain-containing sensor histidine kinase [Alphaproteobacteria bacterium]|nr:PAS domain-containing sensor histidine kinase [Alphaproteobacteria bacterium]MBU1560783.1 PAS domain-containing sensor histidine kinase [Alphaproteobacteria bacterium]MBU2304757.1 PAS domain-containing sensor histidine kinase [Alphaproteobacteria bacterium]MBU2370053.1 PAS domain-containing sensor histidine kinase [Alphaproteobacteria bacterium]
MSEVTANEEARQGVASDAPKPARSLFSTAHNRPLRVLGFVVVLASVLMSSISFLILSGTTNIEPSTTVWTVIWIVTGVLVLLVIALVVTEAVLLFQARMQRQAGAGMQIRMVTMFALVAAIPAAIVAVVATIALNQGLDQWFSERTRAMVESSRLVARSYMLEHAQVLRDDIIWVAEELEQARATFDEDRDRFERILTALAVTRSLPFTSLVDAQGETLMRAQIAVQGAYPQLPAGITEGLVEGIPAAIAPGRINLVGSVIKLRGYDDTFLFVARPVEAEVLEYMQLTDENISEYREYASNRLVFQITFTIMYVGLAVVLLLAALWIGIALANRFVDPIRNLMIASNRVSSGDLDVQVPVQEGRGDLRDLSNGFNRMTQQLKSQREALLTASEMNEKRRQFTEAVVEGVSAGIIGLDPFGAVTLVNARACEMLDREEIDLMGEPIEKVMPQLAPALERARSARRGQVRDQIQLGNETDRRTYQVQLTREGSITESKGYVLTFDDITDLESAQRTSAWADVARRIAHEIKNPLTPIQLSAERLRRRYGARLEDDRDVFDKCINTIVRQVGDIGRMVDEFSAFARMPEAAPEIADLSDTVRQAVFLESVRLPQITIRTMLPEDAILAWFDNRLIAQSMTNLIKNAVEAFETEEMSKDWTPTITVEAQVEGNHARVAVSDNGKGWPKENRQRLLEPYMTTREKGTGLGLAIVAKIIEQHGGIVELIDAEPDPNGRVGACVTFTLPLQSPTKTSAAEAPDQSASKSAQQEEPLISAVVHK